MTPETEAKVALLEELARTLSRQRDELRDLYARFAAAWGIDAARLLVAPPGAALSRAIDTFAGAVEYVLEHRRPR